MSVDGKKRRWGSRSRHDVTVIDKSDLEDTLHKIKEEKKLRPIITVQQSDENLKSELFTGIDLQQPQLMSNERLIEALKKVKVPIPVYSDGSPSRERLLYLYRTHVLPQPQRTRQQWGKRRRARGKRRNNGGMIVVDQTGKTEDCWGSEEGGEKMEVETVDSSGLNSSAISNKRTLSLESEDKDLVPPIKKLLIKSPSSESVPSVTPGSTDPSLQMLQSTAKHKIKVKKPSTNFASGPLPSSRTGSDQVNINTKPSVTRKAITWP